LRAVVYFRRMSIALHWFRNDLRLADNAALSETARADRAAFVFVVEENEGFRPRGGASRWWLHHSLEALSREIAAKGNRLILLRGDSETLIPALAARIGACQVTFNRRTGGVEREADARITAKLEAAGIKVLARNGALLHDPARHATGSGTPFRVFTPFWRAFTAGPAPEAASPPPATLPPDAAVQEISLGTEDIAPLPRNPDWAAGLRATWQPGEAGAAHRLEAFIEHGLHLYAGNRERPDLPATSMLSPHLAFGEISPRQIWHRAMIAREAGANTGDVEKFLAEIGWREFSHHLLFHFPDLARRNFQPKFDAFPWQRNEALLTAWQKGETGYPLVDAGMRQLWRTGTMHNRVRMVVASFLVKHLRIDWREGENWFWDTLCDADPASNPASWQWVAGSGADAAPYFRVFNPISQGEKFDPDGTYIRENIPELAALPAGAIHRPWEAPPLLLAGAGVKLGETYPRPVVSHEAAREKALAAFAALSG